MWRMLMILMPVAAVAGALYLVSRIGKFLFVKRITGNKLWKRMLAGICGVAVISAALYFGLGIINTVICILHIVVIWLLCDLIFFAAAKLRKKKSTCYAAGGAAILISVVWLCTGWYLAHHVAETDYEIKTEKELDGKSLRLVMFADSHVGATFHSEKFGDYLKEMEELHPDAIVIVGDFVDDDTTKEDMVRSCEALGKVETTYGVYYVFGNHDKGYYGPEYRGYSGEELAAELKKNGVAVLEDESVLLNEKFYLIGRQDASVWDRAGMDELIKELDQDRFMVVLDHQPHDYDAQEASGVDLVLSGHTHGGWLFPFNYMGEWTGTDCKTYGREKRSNTEFIVTSGISDWALGFKTGCIAEYVVVDIEQK